MQVRTVANCAATMLLSGLLAACAGWTGAALEGLSQAWRGGVDLAAATRDPGMRYLEVDANGVTALLVLGNLDPDPAGPIEVWYSADKAVLRLQGGRLLGMLGVGSDWADVTLTAAPALASVHARQSFRRSRTEMPGYRQRTDTVQVYPFAGVPDKVPARWRDAGLTWVAETTATVPGQLPAVYGLRDSRLIYGRQCLANDQCISWHALPAASVAPEAKLD